MMYFLILTFSISWMGWFFMPPVYGDFIMFVPGFLAFIFTVCKKEKLKTLFQFSNFSNLILGFIVPILAFILYLIMASLISIQTFGLPESTIIYNNGDIIKAWSRLLIFGLAYMLPISLLFACGEELGWRGYLLRKSKLMIPNFWHRSLIVGIIWGIWHIPFYLFTSSISVAKILIFLVNVCIFSICYTCLYEHKNSIWSTVLVHGMHNFLFNGLLPIIERTNTETSSLWCGEEGFIVTVCYLIVAFSFYYFLKNKKMFI